jgi:hypothetical protein
MHYRFLRFLLEPNPSESILWFDHTHVVFGVSDSPIFPKQFFVNVSCGCENNLP